MIKYLSNPIYPLPIILFIGTTLEDLEDVELQHVSEADLKYIKKVIRDDECTFGLEAQLADNTFIVYIREGREEAHVTVSHELYHVTNAYLGFLGVEHTDKDEAFAYFNGWITEEYYKALDESKN